MRRGNPRLRDNLLKSFPLVLFMRVKLSDSQKKFIILIVAIIVSKLVLLAGADFEIEKFCMRWDGEHFIKIADEGYYDIHELAFGPLFPATIRLLSLVGIETWLAAFIIVNLLSVVPPLIVLRRWGLKPALFLALNPAYVLFTTAPYSEAMALSLALLAYDLREKRPELSGIFLGLAVLAKYTMGLLIFAFLLDGKRIRFLIPFSAFGLVLLLFFNSVGGSPWVYFDIEKQWDAKMRGPVAQIKWMMNSWFTNQPWRIRDFHLRGIHWVVHSWAFLLTYTAGLLILLKEKRVKEFLFSAPFVILQYLVTGVPSISTPRLLLPAVPAWTVLGEKMNRVIFSIIALILLISTYYVGLWHMQAFFG